MPDASFFTVLLDYGALGVIAAILLWVTLRSLKGLREDVKETNEAFIGYLTGEAQENVKAIQANTAALIELTNTQRNISSLMMEHDSRTIELSIRVNEALERARSKV